jgi:hypothetical protein
MRHRAILLITSVGVDSLVARDSRSTLEHAGKCDPRAAWIDDWLSIPLLLARMSLIKNIKKRHRKTEETKCIAESPIHD